MRRTVLAVLLATTALPACAANIEVHSIQGKQIITIDGEIGPSDFEVFKVKASPLGGRAAVLLGSPGGDVMAALQIGEFIRLRGWATTVLNECDGDCALIWLAGVERFMAATARIGFHAANVAGREKGMGKALVGAYVNRLGLSYDAVALATQAGPDETIYLTPAEARRTGIELSVIEPRPVQDATVQPTTPQQASAKAQPGPPADIQPLGGVTYLTSHPGLNNGTVEEQLASIIAYLIASWNSGYMQGLAELYSDNVLYYGKPSSRASIMLDKQRFIERWVYRSYKVRPNSTSIRCDGSDTQLDECAVWGTVDYEAVSKQSKQSAGSANFSYVLKPHPAGSVRGRAGNQTLDLRITAENSTVTERKVTGWAIPAGSESRK